MFKWLIVGAGFTGATLAERIATQLGQKVLVVDRRPHIGGNAYDYYNEHGILVHKYGPHIFHTNSKKVWQYVSNFTSWRPYFHQVLGSVSGKKVPVPFNLNSLHMVFPTRMAERIEQTLVDDYGFGKKVPILKLRESSSPDIQQLAEYVYENVFLGYTLKQWELRPEELAPSVTARVPVFVSKDDRYFQDTYQGMPALGYTEVFRRMLSHNNISVLLNSDYKDICDLIPHERVIYTGQIDELLDYQFGELPYRSLRFDVKTVDCERWQPVGTVNYPNEYEFTRITEQKVITGQTSDKTTLVTEHPERYMRGVNEPYYPIPRDENREIYRKYSAELSNAGGRVMVAGRLGDYKYYNMDQAIASALKLFESEIAE